MYIYVNFYIDGSKMANCGKCSKKVSADDIFLDYSKCKGSMHSACVNASKALHKSIPKNSSVAWSCLNCTNDVALSPASVLRQQPKDSRKSMCKLGVSSKKVNNFRTCSSPVDFNADGFVCGVCNKQFH